MDKKTNSFKRGFLNFLKRLKNSLIVLLIFLIFIAIMWLAYESDKDSYLDERYFNKTVIYRDLNNAIENDADIYTVKNIYKNKDIKTKGVTDVVTDLFTDKSNSTRYLESTSLSVILDDMVSYHYINHERDSIDIKYIGKLKKIISDFNQINPFEKLNTNQKYHFENLRTKLGPKYDLIRNNVKMISEELYNKNKLVSFYLDRSNTSFWISIFAASLSIVFFIIQTIQNFLSSKKYKKDMEFISSKLTDK